MALGGDTIDPASFTTIRLVAGMAMLLLVTSFTRERQPARGGSWAGAAVLFLYAATFSFAYVSLTTGTGALLLFGFVQVTMMLAALAAGERPHPLQWLGLVLAVSGLIYLVLPGLTAPPLAGAAMMGASGVFWGIYSIRGRGAQNPLADTTTNFVRSVPLGIMLSAFMINALSVEPRGAMLAAASGAVTSGLGYVVWYAALTRLTGVRAAIVQLPVPILSASAGVVFLHEQVSFRLVASAVLVLGGIAVALVGRERLAG
jgi:drug/metabolite transporter (DMT)-like permease